MISTRRPVFTIHGFCQRTLQENAFESGHLFDTELVTEQDDLKLEIVEDFWRQHFYQAPPFLVQHALERGYSPTTLMRMVKTAAIQPDIKVLPEVQPPAEEELQQALDHASGRYSVTPTTMAGMP